MGTVRELRIHGVGGSPGETLLGLSRPDDAVVVGEGLGTVFLARRQEDGRPVEGYDWGALTSSSALQPLWLLLLPFTLLNVAGWMHPAFDRARWGRGAWWGQVGLIRALVRALGVLLTASWTLWAGVVAVDYLGYQWVGVLPSRPDRLLGVTTGFAVTACLTGLLLWIGASTKQSFEGQQPDDDVLGADERPRAWGREETLADRTFFSHEPSMTRQLRRHVVAAGLAGAALLAKTVLAWGQPRLLLGELIVVLGGAQLILLGTLAVVSWPTGGQYATARRPHALAAAAATLSVALTNGFMSGAALLVARLLPDPAARPWGPELALVDVFVWVLVVWAVTAGSFVAWHRRRGEAADLPPRRSRLGQELDGVDDRWRAAVARARGLATAGHAAPVLLSMLAAEFWVLAALFALRRADFGQPPWRWLPPPDGRAWVFQAAAVVLPALVLATMSLVRRATGAVRLRRSVGILWDVLTFWPRRFHPLAVRPYTERAVPEFQARVNAHVTAGRRVLVSAHSQGSVIAFTALAPLWPWKLGRCALLTYGCPVTTLYGAVFPAYFGRDQTERLRAELLGGSRGWRNLWRRTDPIGGPVFGGPGDDPDDAHVPDPAAEPSSADVPAQAAPLEDYRRAWVQVAGHSFFLRERPLKQAVAELVDALRAVDDGGAGRGDGAAHRSPAAG